MKTAPISLLSCHGFACQRPRCLVGGFLLGLICTWAVPLSGQDKGKTEEKTVGLDIAEVSGTLEGMQADKLKIKSEDGKEYFIVIGPQTSLQYLGSAEAQFLSPGLLVRFTAAFNPQNGVPQNAVTSLEIFRPAKQRRMSVEQKQAQTPGVYPVHENASKSRKKEKADNPPPPAGAQNFKIVGQIRAVMADKLHIAAGLRPVLVSLDPSAKITVASGDTYFCKQGDQVQVSGLKSPTQDSWIQAESVEITGSENLSPTQPNATRKSRATRGNAGEADDGKKPGTSSESKPESARTRTKKSD